MRSIAIFGIMRPKLIAKLIEMAVMPSAIVALMSSNVVCDPSRSCTRPLAILNTKTPRLSFLFSFHRMQSTLR